MRDRGQAHHKCNRPHTASYAAAGARLPENAIWSPNMRALLLLSCLLAGAAPALAKPTSSYAARRRAFHTAIHDAPRARRPAPEPPDGVYEKVQYPAPLGLNTAYVTPVSRDGKKRPAIVWIQGGLDWSVSESAWRPAPITNDQSARAFREAGMVELLPSLRGCNDNPGDHEYFLGEVDDVLAALDFLRKRPDVDPTRLYLGGHSTGGTMALLAAASRPQVRAVFAFGPVAEIAVYSKLGTADDAAGAAELAIRSPVSSLSEANMPVFVIEGDQRGNSGSFAALRAAAKKAPVRFLLARGANHFSTLAPVTALIAERLVRAAAGGPAFDSSDADLANAVAKAQR